MKNLIDILDLSTAEIDEMIAVANNIIEHPELYREACKYKTLATLFFEPSTRTGTKDIIKIASDKDLDLGVLSFVCPTATINVIRDGRVLEKRNVELPEKIVDILKCKNPRCITTTEQEIHHVFVLTDAEKGEYRCMYCDTKASN